MNVRSLMNKQKLIVDGIISVLLILTLLFLALFIQLLAFMSIGVYSFFCLLLFGIYRSYKGIMNRRLRFILRVLNFLLGIVCIIFPSYMLNYMFKRPNIPASFIIYFLGIPIFFIGLAGLLKGLIVTVYSPLFRFLNVIIGATTIFFTVIAIIFSETGYIFHLFTLLTTLTLNGILRAALYLSEYGLSLKSFRNLKLVLFIMNSPHLAPKEENQIKP